MLTIAKNVIHVVLLVQEKRRVSFMYFCTHENMELIKRLERSQRFDQVWYFNCGIYGRTENGLQTKFQIYKKQ